MIDGLGLTSSGGALGFGVGISLCEAVSVATGGVGITVGDDAGAEFGDGIAEASVVGGTGGFEVQASTRMLEIATTRRFTAKTVSQRYESLPFPEPGGVRGRGDAWADR